LVIEVVVGVVGQRWLHAAVVAIVAAIVVAVVAAKLSWLSLLQSLAELSPSLWPYCHGCRHRRCRSRHSRVVMVVTAVAAAIIIAVVVASLLRSSWPYCHSRRGGVVAVVEAIVVTVGGRQWS
jgi:putative flippase GtrA